MNIDRIVNAWRDEEYRGKLDEASREALPASPVGEIDLSETDLEQVAGGDAEATTWWCATVTLFSAVYCASILAGGTCQNDTSGCCPKES